MNGSIGQDRPARRKVIAVSDVQAAAKNGKVVSVPIGAIVTPAARERAKELGVALQDAKLAQLVAAPFVPLPDRRSGDLSGTLAEFAADFPAGKLPVEIVQWTKVLLLDVLAVGLAGAGATFGRQLLAGAVESGRSRVFGSRLRLPARDAAVVNGSLAHSLEFDPTFDEGLIHPASGIVAAALAAADETSGTTGIGLLTAIAVGMESACRVALAATAPPRFYRCASMAALGGTIAAAHIYGLSPEATLNAIGIAMSQGPMGWEAHDEGSTVHGALPGFAAGQAIEACRLDRAGVTGPARSLEGPDGYFQMAEGGVYDRNLALDGLGDEWRILRIGLKPFPSGRLTHGAIDAALMLRERYAIGPSDIRRVDVSVSRVNADRTGRVPSADAGVVHQRLSLPFVVAQAFLHGDAGVTRFGPDRAADVEVQQLLGRIFVATDQRIPATALVPVVMRVQLHDGRVLVERVDALRGSIDRPLTREERLAKVKTCVALSPLPRWRAGTSLVDAVENLDKVRSTRRLWAALTP